MPADTVGRVLLGLILACLLVLLARGFGGGASAPARDTGRYRMELTRGPDRQPVLLRTDVRTGEVSILPFNRRGARWIALEGEYPPPEQ